MRVDAEVCEWWMVFDTPDCRRHAVARLLGERGAQVNVRGKSGSTAFDIANMIGRHTPPTAVLSNRQPSASLLVTGFILSCSRGH